MLYRINKCSIRLLQATKIAKILYFAMFFGTQLVSMETNVLKAILPFQPHLVGYINNTTNHVYFATGNRKLIVLNQNFQILNTQAFPKETSVIDFQDLNADGLSDIIELTSNGAWVRYQKTNHFFQVRKKIITGHFLAPSNTIFLETIPMGFMLNPSTQEPALLLPSEGKFLYYKKKNNVFQLQRELPFEARSLFSSRIWKNSDVRNDYLKATYYFPRPNYQDLNHDGLTDVSFRIRRKIYFFLSQNKLLFANTMVRSFPVKMDDVYSASYQLKDVDGDNNLDVIFSIISGLGMNIQNESNIFWGKDGFPVSASPTIKVHKGGFFPPLMMQAKDKVYAIIPKINLGLSFFMTYLLRGNIPITAAFYSFKDKKFRKEKELSFSFDSQGNLLPGFTMLDANKDGYTDFLIGETLHSAILYGGNKELSKNEISSITIPSYGIFIPQDTGSSPEVLVYLPQKIKEYNQKEIYLIRFINPPHENK